VLADPRLEVFDGTTRVAGNDNWESPLAGTFAQVGAFALPPSSLDSAVVVTLAAGKSYTAQVSGVNGGTGEALVEVYELPPCRKADHPAGVGGLAEPAGLASRTHPEPPNGSGFGVWGNA